MTDEIHMTNLNFILQGFLTYFPETNCDDESGRICDPSHLRDTTLLQP